MSSDSVSSTSSRFLITQKVQSDKNVHCSCLPLVNLGCVLPFVYFEYIFDDVLFFW